MKSRTADPLPVYVVYGNDDFLRGRALARVLRETIGADRDRMAVAEFDGDSAELAAVLDECRTASLLAPLRVVVVRDADGFVTANREPLERYLQSPCPTGVLVLVCRSWQRRTRLFKRVEEIGENIECTTPKGPAILGWLTQQAADAYGCRLDGAAARCLFDLVGPDLGLLDMELSKLATYVHPRTTIGRADVEALVGSSRVEKVFGITDAIGRGDAGAALALWDQVVASDRDAEYRAVGGLAYGFRKLAEAKRLMARGVPPPQVVRQLGIFKDPQSLRIELDRFSLAEWEAVLGRLLAIDLGAKTGLGSVRIGVEKLIVSLCARASKPGFHNRRAAG